MYHLVSFCDNSGTGIIYDSWLEGHGESEDSILVAYPPKEGYNKLRTYLHNKSNPPPIWDSYEALILFSAESLSEVRAKASSFSMGETSLEENEVQQKRRIQKTTRYGFQDMNVTPTKKAKSAACPEESPPSQSSGISILKKPTSPFTLPPIPISSAAVSFSPTSSLSQSHDNTRPTDVQANFLQIISNKLDANYRKLCTVSSRQRQLFDRVKRMEVMLAEFTGSENNNGTESFDFPGPASTMDEYYSLKERITENQAFREKFVCKLFRIGGHSEKDMVARTIPVLLTNELQKQCNRTGTRGKLSFSGVFEDVLKDAILQRFPDANLANVESRVAAYLTASRDRDGGHRQRTVKDTGKSLRLL